MHRTLALCLTSRRILCRLPWNLRSRSLLWILSHRSNLRFRVLSTLPRPRHPRARALNIFPLEPMFFKDLRLTRRSSWDGDPTLAPTRTRPLTLSPAPLLLAPGRSVPSGYVPPVPPCHFPLPNPLAPSPHPPLRPRSLPRFKPALTFPRPARLQPHAPPPSTCPSSQPSRHPRDWPLTRPSTSPSSPTPSHNVASPSTSPTSPPPVPLRVISPSARPFTSSCRPSTSFLSPHPRPAPDLPLTHVSVTSPGPSSHPTKTGGSSRPRPSTSPHSIAPPCPSPISDVPPRPGAHTSTFQPCPLPPLIPDPVPPSNPLSESSSQRHKRRNRGLVGAGTQRLAHGTVRGTWSGSQLIKALYSLCDTRMPGSGAHRQLRFPWKGNTVLVNTWHTGRVHLQGFGAGDLARQLSEMSPSASRVRTRSSSPGSAGDSSGDGNNPSWVGQGLCLTLFLWIIHLWISAGLRFSGGLRLFSSFLPRRVIRRKKIRGAGRAEELVRGKLSSH